MARRNRTRSISPRRDPALQASALLESAGATRPTNAKAGGSGRGSVPDAEVWGWYDQVGEVRFYANWLRNVCSQGQLVASEIGDDGLPKPTENGTAQDITAQIVGPGGDVGSLLGNAAMHLGMTGHFRTFGYLDEESGDAVFEALSLDELKRDRDGSTWIRNDGLGERKYANTDVSVFRVWRPHPKMSGLADSPVKSAGPTVRELLKLNDYIATSFDSRLKGPGFLIYDEDFSFHSAAFPDTEDGWERAMHRAGQAAINDPTHPARHFPIMVKRPKGGEMERMTFESPLDSWVMELREQEVKSLARSLDFPAEVLMGMGDTTTYANGWLISREAIRSHAGPTLTIITQALTEFVLWPELRQAGVQDPEQFVVDWDLSGFTSREDRTDDALKLKSAGLINDETALQLSGVSADAAPDEEAKERALLETLVVGAPSLAPLILPILLPEQFGAGTPAIETTGREIPPAEDDDEPDTDRNDENGETDQIDARPEEVAASLAVAADAAIAREVERIGNTIRNRARRYDVALTASSATAAFTELTKDEAMRVLDAADPRDITDDAEMTFLADTATRLGLAPFPLVEAARVWLGAHLFGPIPPVPPAVLKPRMMRDRGL